MSIELNYDIATGEILGAHNTGRSPSPFITVADDAWLEGDTVINGVLVHNTNPAYKLAKDSAQVEQVLQEAIDTEAKARGYDNIVSATSYAGYVNVFQAEAIALGEWRSAIWAYCYTELAAIQAGTRTMPATVELFVAEVLSACPKPV